MPYLKSTVVCLIILLSGFSNLFAQKLKFGQLSNRDGLPGTEVYNLYQDKKGYLWAFTEYGIVKHNGMEFIPVCKNLPLSESAVYVVAENSKGEIYFANSRANIYTIKNDSAFLLEGLKNISEYILSQKEIMFDLLVDDSSSVYFSTLHTSYKYLSAEKKTINLTEQYSKNYKGICFKKIKSAFFLIKLNPSSEKEFITILDEKDKITGQVPYNSVIGERNIIRKGPEGYYFLTVKTLYFLSNKGYLKSIDFKENTITLEISPDQRIWIGVLSAGLYELTPDLTVSNHYLNGITVSDILFDNQSGIWVSTIGSGVYYCKNIYDTYYEDTPGLSDNISVIKQLNSMLFIGTSEGNVFIKEKNTLKKVDPQKYRSAVNDILYINGQYLIGTKNGIWGVDSDLSRVEEYKTSVGTRASMSSYEFAEGERDTFLFVSGSSLLKFHAEKKFFQHNFKTKTRGIIRRTENEYIIGTSNGLYTFNGHRVNRPPYLHILNNARISGLKKDGKGNIWICTREDGLYILNVKNELTRYENIPSNIINDISFAKEGIVLLSTNKGLFINYTNDPHSKSWVLIFDNETLCAEEYDNDIYIGTKQGLVSLSGKNLLKNDNSNFYLESIQVYDEKINADSIHLKYFQNDLYFNFDFLAYQFPDKKLYYQLFGNSSNKGVVKGTQIHLQNLLPGHYTLIVHPLINLSNKRIFKIYFYIEPAFWQTKTFLIVVIGSFILLLICSAAYIIYRIKKKEEHKATMTAITALLAEYRLTALKAQINPHFISNSLSSIQELIRNNEIDSANQYIAKFSLLIRYVLKYSDKSAVRLKHEIEIIDLNIELEQLRFEYKFLFEKEIDPEIITSDIYIPPLITQPFIENAIWHGLLPLKNKRPPRLLLKICLIADKLMISIIDNGVGMKRKSKQDLKHEDKESKGVWLTQNRMSTLNTLYASSEAKINFTDLFDDEKNPTGTQVDIIFPLSILEKLHEDKYKERYY